MAGWNSIIFDDPTSGHPMLPQVVQVMRCIYTAVNPERPPPFTVDIWWHSLSLSYQVQESGREPSIVILNLREGEPHQPAMDPHFMINLNTMRVHDKFQDHRFPVPQEILPVLGELKEYVRSIVRGRWEAKEAQNRETARRLEKEREEQRNRVQAFCRGLVENGFIDEDDASHFSGDSLNCPVCSARQTSCNMCKVISCSNGDCEVSSAIPIVQCSNHHNTKFCTSCLELPGSLPRLGKCPMCARWFCSSELQWCIGRPVCNDGTGLSPPNIDVTRLHSARPLSCRTIACMDKTRESGKNGRHCCNARCWSRVGTATCSDCVTQDSFACPCGQYWTCGGCESQASSASGFITCPGCHRRFCSSSCSYIGTCELCNHVEPCRDCIRNGKSVEEEHTMFMCQGCKGLLCETCSDLDEKTCCRCDQSICKLCAHEEDDSDCPDIVCDQCRGSSDQYDYEDMAYGDYL
ncbi:uncharacterized protein F5891DRAFT_575353 [Suillus fuscotomentosus]|uniref:Uncharacterized protein n=1 Tax=Suillus fuscotomentosus TaxID=1912939 RepID=A0AAD4DZ33_9AGAM|nr:uncharacterized protein F5891DRAFT_575353 [Suillus fuscotomentosus]KAG1896755.1 hypothetical protein F5891DRAFT_575353 [Suillus fuscotomentosus]